MFKKTAYRVILERTFTNIISRWEKLVNEKTSSLFVRCAISLLFLVEMTFYLPADSIFRRLAFFCWVSVSVATLGSALLYSIGFIWESEFWSRPHAAWFLMAFFTPPLLAYFNLNGFTFCGLDREGVGQLNSIRVLFNDDKAGGLFQTGYGSGYPVRQYILANLYTMVFGSSLICLRLGNSLPFMAGYFFFLSSIRRFLISRDVPLATLLSSFAGVTSSLGLYSLLELRRFEQASIPGGILMFFLGGILCFLMKPSLSRVLWPMWSVGLLPFCYTPAIAGWGLGLLILCYLYCRRYYNLFPAIIYAVVCFYVFFLISEKSARIEDKLHFTHRMHDAWVQRCLEGFYRFFGPELSVVPIPLSLAVFCCLYLAWKQKEYWYFVLFSWVIVVIFCAVVFVGCGFNILQYTMGRSLTAVPALAFGVVMTLAKCLDRNRESPAFFKPIALYFKASILYVIFASTDMLFFTQSNWFVAGESEEALYDLSQMKYSKDSSPKVAYMLRPLNHDSLSYGNYFFPELRVIDGPPPLGEHLPGNYIFSMGSESNPIGSRILVTKE